MLSFQLLRVPISRCPTVERARCCATIWIQFYARAPRVVPAIVAWTVYNNLNRWMEWKGGQEAMKPNGDANESMPSYVVACLSSMFSPPRPFFIILYYRLEHQSHTLSESCLWQKSISDETQWRRCHLTLPLALVLYQAFCRHKQSA